MAPPLSPDNIQMYYEHRIKDYWNNTVKQLPMLKFMQDRGNIMYNKRGKELQVDIVVGRARASSVGVGGDASALFDNNQVMTDLILPWANITSGYQISKDEVRLIDGHAPDVLDVHRKKGDMALEAVGRFFQSGLLDSDLGTSADALPLGGLPSFFDGGTIAAVTDKEASAQGTYGNLTVVDGGHGRDNEIPKATSPLLVNTAATTWQGGATNTWSENAFDIISYATHELRINRGGTAKKYRELFGMLNTTDYLALKQKISGFERIERPFGRTDDGELTLGSGMDMVMWDGVSFMADQDIDADQGYILNPNFAWLYFAPTGPTMSGDRNISQSKLKDQRDPSFQQGFDVETEFDINTSAAKVKMSAFCQYVFNPRYHCFFNRYSV